MAMTSENTIQWIDEQIREARLVCEKKRGDLITIANEQGKIEAYEMVQVALLLRLSPPSKPSASSGGGLMLKFMMGSAADSLTHPTSSTPSSPNWEGQTDDKYRDRGAAEVDMGRACEDAARLSR
jgi:hypothetical protein